MSRKVEFHGKDKDGKHVNGMIRSESRSVEELRLAIRNTLIQAGIDVNEQDIEVMGIVPWGETRIIQMSGEET